MVQASTHRLQPNGRASGSGIALYSHLLQALWTASFLISLLLELMPAPGVAPVIFYVRASIKLTLIFFIGFLSPLAFWRFDSLTLGACVAILATVVAEGSQSLVKGHSSSWLELTGKILITFVGFAWALNARYEHKLKVGPISIHLKHPPARAVRSAL